MMGTFRHVVVFALLMGCADFAQVQRDRLPGPCFAESNGTRWTYVYDDRGNVLTVEVDHSIDGTVDSVRTYTYDYDANGEIQTEIVDIDAIAGDLIAYTYDERGNLVVEETYEIYSESGSWLTWNGNRPEDSQLRKRETYTYDSDGNLLVLQIADDEGIVYERRTYTHDEEGNRLSVVTDVDADGTIDDLISYTYDERGLVLTSEWDGNADGIADSRTTYAYDEHGNTLTEEVTDFTDATVSRRTYSYDCQWGGANPGE